MRNIFINKSQLSENKLEFKMKTHEARLKTDSGYYDYTSFNITKKGDLQKQLTQWIKDHYYFKGKEPVILEISSFENGQMAATRSMEVPQEKYWPEIRCSINDHFVLTSSGLAKTIAVT